MRKDSTTMPVEQPTRIPIDLNVRVRGNLTYALAEEAQGGVRVGDRVIAFEAESRAEGPAEVVDIVKNYVYLAVDWEALRVPAEPSREVATFRVHVAEWTRVFGQQAEHTPFRGVFVGGTLVASSTDFERPTLESSGMSLGR